MKLRLHRLVLPTLFAVLQSWSLQAMPNPPASATRSFHLAIPPERAITLFTAEGERLWVDGWNPEILSGDAARGSVFVTRGHGRGATHWIVVGFDPAAGRASYARLADGSSFGLVDVTCSPGTDGGTDVAVRYTLTPLGAAGEADVAAFLEPARYAHTIDGWRDAIEAALARGRLP